MERDKVYLVYKMSLARATRPELLGAFTRAGLKPLFRGLVRDQERNSTTARQVQRGNKLSRSIEYVWRGSAFRDHYDVVELSINERVR